MKKTIIIICVAIVLFMSIGGFLYFRYSVSYDKAALEEIIQKYQSVENHVNENSRLSQFVEIGKEWVTILASIEDNTSKDSSDLKAAWYMLQPPDVFWRSHDNIKKYREVQPLLAQGASLIPKILEADKAPKGAMPFLSIFTAHENNSFTALLNLLDLSKFVLIYCNQLTIDEKPENTWPLIITLMNLAQDLQSNPTYALQYYVGVSIQAQVVSWLGRGAIQYTPPSESNLNQLSTIANNMANPLISFADIVNSEIYLLYFNTKEALSVLKQIQESARTDPIFKNHLSFIDQIELRWFPKFYFQHQLSKGIRRYLSLRKVDINKISDKTDESPTEDQFIRQYKDNLEQQYIYGAGLHVIIALASYFETHHEYPKTLNIIPETDQWMTLPFNDSSLEYKQEDNGYRISLKGKEKGQDNVLDFETITEPPLSKEELFQSPEPIADQLEDAPSINNTPSQPKQDIESLLQKKISNTNTVSITNSDREKYSKNFDQMYTDIRAVPFFYEGKVFGMKVLGVEQGTLFNKMSIQRGDILISINNQEIDVKEGFAVFAPLFTPNSTNTLILIRGDQKIKLIVKP